MAETPRRPAGDERTPAGRQSARQRGGQRFGARRSEPNSLSLMGAGVELCGAVVGLTLVGWWMDSRWGSRPWLMLAGLAVGLLGGMYNLYRSGKRFFKD